MLVKSLSGGKNECKHSHSLSGEEIQFNFLNPEDDFVVMAVVHNSQIQVCFVKNKGIFFSIYIFFVHTVVNHLALIRIADFC